MACPGRQEKGTAGKDRNSFVCQMICDLHDPRRVRGCGVSVLSILPRNTTDPNRNSAVWKTSGEFGPQGHCCPEGD